MDDKVRNPMDEKTLSTPGLTYPIERRHKRPLALNPIRRFREELQLTRAEFAELFHASEPTVKAWEDMNAFVPRSEVLIHMVEVAREAKYPLLVQEIWDFSLEARERRARSKQDQVGNS